MYGGMGGGPVAGATTTIAGVTMLPNTSGNTLLTGIALFNIAVGVVILITTAVRIAAKRSYKA